MGLYMGTLYWKETPNKCYMDELETLAIKNGLDIMNDYPATLFETYDNNFSVGIGGFWLTLYDRDECTSRINAFLSEGQTLLNKFGIETKTKTEFLDP